MNKESKLKEIITINKLESVQLYDNYVKYLVKCIEDINIKTYLVNKTTSISLILKQVDDYKKALKHYTLELKKLQKIDKYNFKDTNYDWFDVDGSFELRRFLMREFSLQ